MAKHLEVYGKYNIAYECCPVLPSWFLVIPSSLLSKACDLISPTTHKHPCVYCLCSYAPKCSST